MKQDDLQLRFKQAREALKLSQVQVAELLGKSQRMISNYENGKKGPPLKMVETLEVMLEDKSPVPESLTLLTDDEFFERLRRWSEEWEAWSKANLNQGDSCDFFFFGPEHMPVFENDGMPMQRFIQRFWTSNLVGKRINYNVFWILDGCDFHEFRSAMLTLRKIDTQVRFLSTTKPEAKLCVRGVAVTQDSGNEVLKFYQNACETLEHDHDPKAVLKVDRPHFVQNDPRWNRVLRIGTEIPLMVVRVKWSMSASPLVPPPDFSACRLENVSRWIGGKVETGWVLHNKDKTVELVKYIDSITDKPAAECEDAAPLARTEP